MGLCSPSWLFDPRHPSTGASRLLVSSWCQNGNLWGSPCQSVLPGASATCVLAPIVSQSQPHLHRRTFQCLWVGLAQSCVESLLCAGSLCMSYLCASARVGSVSLSPVELLYSSPAVLQNQMLWRLLLPIPDPQTGESDVELRTLTPLGDPLQSFFFFF